VTLLRINGICYFAAHWGEAAEEDKLFKPSGKMKVLSTQDDFDYALFELCWHLHDCAEAVEVFSTFAECPVCLARATDGGNMIHKEPKLLIN